MTEPSSITIKAWARLIRAHQQALSSVENALKIADLPPLAWYDVLLELEQAGKQGLRPFELQRKLLLPQYGISRLISRMEKSGFVESRSCQADGRGLRLATTKAGKELQARMWKIYGPAIENAVGEKLNPNQTSVLSTLLAQLID